MISLRHHRQHRRPSDHADVVLANCGHLDGNASRPYGHACSMTLRSTTFSQPCIPHCHLRRSAAQLLSRRPSDRNLPILRSLSRRCRPSCAVAGMEAGHRLGFRLTLPESAAPNAPLVVSMLEVIQSDCPARRILQTAAATCCQQCRPADFLELTSPNPCAGAFSLP